MLCSFLKLSPRIRTTNPPSAEPLGGVISEMYGGGHVGVELGIEVGVMVGSNVGDDVGMELGAT